MILRTFVDGDSVSHALGSFLELRHSIDFCVEIPALGVETPHGLHSGLYCHAIGHVPILQFEKLVEGVGRNGVVPFPGDALPRVGATGLDGDGDGDFVAAGSLGVAGEAHCRRSELYLQEAMGHVDGPNLLEFEYLNAGAGVRLA